jgi:hypothetical protein
MVLLQRIELHASYLPMWSGMVLASKQGDKHFYLFLGQNLFLRKKILLKTITLDKNLKIEVNNLIILEDNFLTTFGF